MPKFPFTNYHELNLDWILKKVEALFTASEENARTIRTYDTRLTRTEQTATNAETAATSAQQLADAAAATAGNALSVAGTADQKADSALTAATDASSAVSGALTAAQEAQQTAGAAVATANDAAATASGLESLANTANQNATAAVETAGTAVTRADNAAAAAQNADQKAVAAQQTANSAQAAASTNAGNISTLQTNVTDLNRQISDSTTGLNSKAPVIVNTASGDIASFADGADDMPIKSLVVNIEPVQSGSGDPSPENIRPISGWKGAEIEQRGKNLFENTATSLTSNGVTFTINSDGMVTCSGTATGTAVLNIVDPNGINQLTDSLILSGCPAGGDINNTYGLAATTIEGTRLYADSGNGVAMVNYATFAKLQIVIRSGVNANGLVFKPMIRLATETDSTFEPYQGETISITFPSESGTVYGGTLDVTNGVLTVDRACVVIDGINITALNNGHTNITTRAIFMANSPAKAYGQDNFISDKFHYTMAEDIIGKANGRLATTGVEFYLPNDVPDTSAGVNAWFADNPTQLCYHIANPITYQLTPQQLDTLLGTNNIWADVGTVDVEYPADTKLYIEQLTKPTEDDMTADHAISAGTFFMIGNTLYLATSQIAAGGTITPGTNATQLSLADALNQLNT